MRLIVNRDEAANFRKALQREIDAEASTVSITLKMGLEDAQRVVSSSSDNEPIECVWSGVSF